MRSLGDLPPVVRGASPHGQPVMTSKAAEATTLVGERNRLVAQRPAVPHQTPCFRGGIPTGRGPGRSCSDERNMGYEPKSRPHAPSRGIAHLRRPDIACRPVIQRGRAAQSGAFSNCGDFPLAEPEGERHHGCSRLEHAIEKIRQFRHRLDHRIASDRMCVPKIAVEEIASLQEHVRQFSGPNPRNPIRKGRHFDAPNLCFWKSERQGDHQRAPAQLIDNRLLNQAGLP